MHASHLLKYCQFIEDSEGYPMELKFLRDTDGRKINSLVLKNSIPTFAVECKSGENAFSKRSAYFKDPYRHTRSLSGASWHARIWQRDNDWPCAAFPEILPAQKPGLT
jgi:hypothetical protein